MTSPALRARMPADAERAAAVAIATLPGATLWYEGQFEGLAKHGHRCSCRAVRAEPPDIGLANWYRRRLDAVAAHRVRAGAWRLLEAGGWPDNQSLPQSARLVLVR